MPVIDVQVHPFDRNHPGRGVEVFLSTAGLGGECPRPSFHKTSAPAPPLFVLGGRDRHLYRRM